MPPSFFVNETVYPEIDGAKPQREQDDAPGLNENRQIRVEADHDQRTSTCDTVYFASGRNMTIDQSMASKPVMSLRKNVVGLKKRFANYRT